MIKELSRNFREATMRLEVTFPVYKNSDPQPRRLPLVHFVWARVATRGTGNLGWWVPTFPLSEEGRLLQERFWTDVQAALPKWAAPVDVLRRIPKFWELADQLAQMTEADARRLASLPDIYSWRAATEFGVASLCPTIPRLGALQDLCRACFEQQEVTP